MANQFVQLKNGNDNLFPKTTIIGVDVDNVIATVSGEYTATEDCIYKVGELGRVDMNNVTIYQQNDAKTVNMCGYFVLKKGQTITIRYTNVVVFGIKY